MKDKCFIPLISVIDLAIIPSELNNPFHLGVPKIAKIAATQLQDYLLENDSQWIHNFGIDNSKTIPPKGKMFGVLVVRLNTGELGFLSTFSGTIEDEPHPEIFVPSLFDISTNDFFINKGMQKLTEIGNQIETLKASTPINTKPILELKEQRKNLSKQLQQELFDQYIFLNNRGESKNLCSIFEDYNHKKPPSGAGECAGPKLLQYAFENNMTPIAITEFWWGKAPDSDLKNHKKHYPACQDKCLPILSYMLSIR